MKHINLLLRKVTISLFTLMFAFFSLSPALAYGPTEPTGIQGEIGNIEPTGNVAPTGVRFEESVDSAENTQPSSTETTLQNEQTGPDSSNENDLTSSSTTDASIINDTGIDNQTDMVINTGGNDISHNTSVESIETGSIDGSVTILNMADTSLAEGSSAGTQTIPDSHTGDIVLTPADNRTSISNSGSGSTNVNTLDSQNALVIQSGSNTNVDNNLVIDANTGKNSIADNSRVGDVITGNINLAANLVNLLNVVQPDLLLSLDIWSILGNFTGDIIIDEFNDTTGPDSVNNNSVNSSQNSRINAENNANIENAFDFDFNTGENDIDANTSVGSITTGASKVSGSVTNVNGATLPIIYLFNVLGEWDGSLLGLDPNQVIVNAQNVLTGPGSDNLNDADLQRDTRIDIENNASVNNQVEIKANTGKNRIGNNTVVSNLTTGAINISANIVNILNSFSKKSDKIAFRIVNIFGKFKGNIKKKEVAKEEAKEEKPPIIEPVEEKIAPVIPTEVLPVQEIPPAAPPAPPQISGEVDIPMPPEEPEKVVLARISAQPEFAEEITPPEVPDEEEFLGPVGRLPQAGGNLPLWYYLAGSAFGLVALWGIAELVFKISQAKR